MYNAAGRKKFQPIKSEHNVNHPSEASLGGRLPNSTMLSMMDTESVSGSAIENLGMRLRQRIDTEQEHSQAQIPQAESEADRLSASVHTGSPESVKTAMGQRMGADFSGVRFHTGALAAAKADAMGARAYTSGMDVYFGSGGFDASIAAHELVHTAQQGGVASDTTTMSTPTGGVQMWPWSKKSKAKKMQIKPVMPDEEMDAISNAVTQLGNWGDTPDVSEEDLKAELAELEQGGSKQKEVSLAELEQQADEEMASGDMFDGMRDTLNSYRNMQSQEGEIKKWSKRANKKVKKLDKETKRNLKKANRFLAQMDAEMEQLMNMEELPELYGFDEEAELENLMREDDQQGDSQTGITDEELEQMYREEMSNEAAQAALTPAKEKKGFFSRIGSGIKNFGKKIWNNTGGRTIRKHHDAMVELHEAVQSGKWDQLTPEEQKNWKKSNRVAYRRYMNSDKVKAETALRAGKRQQEREAAAAFFAQNEGQLGRSSMLTTSAAAPAAAGAAGASSASGSAAASRFAIGHGTADAAGDVEAATLDDNLGKLTDTVDKVTVPPSLVNAAQEAKVIGDSTAAPINGFLAGANVATGGIGMYQSGKEMKEAFSGNNKAAQADASIGMISNTAKTTNGLGTFAKVAGSELGSKFAAGADIVTGSADVYKGARQIHQGRMKANAMEQFQQKYFGPIEREQLADKEMILRDISTQGKMEGTRQKIKGAGKVVTGAVDAVAGAGELSGIGSAVGFGLKVGNVGLKAGFAAANKAQKNRMTKKVVEQTTGLTDEKIRAFQKASGIRSFSRAKQALMKSKGYESGTRAELYADQTEKRGQYLAELANSGVESDKANQLVMGLGVQKTNGAYNAEEITKSLGHWKSRAEIASGHNSINKMLQNRRRTAPAAP